VPTPTPTIGPGRQTVAVGVIRVTADSFTDIGGGQLRASGNVWLGDHLALAGDSDYVTFTAATLTGIGNLQQQTGNLALFTGNFSADPATGLLTPASDVTYNLDRIAGFPITATLTISQVDSLTGVVSGSATLDLTPPGVTGSATVAFQITPGPAFAGTLAAFHLSVAGVTLDVPDGATLDNNGIDAPSVVLTLPAVFGGATTTVSNLHIGPNDISLGSAGVRFGLPNLNFGDGSKLKLTNNQAQLTYDSASQRYKLDIQSRFVVNLPDNTQTIDVQVALASVAGQPQLQGTIASLSLSVAGTTLALTNLAFNNDGLTVDSATLTLPPGLGGSTVTVAGVSITSAGLAFAGGSVTLPDITFGGSAVQERAQRVSGLARPPLTLTPTPPLALRNNQATLTVVDNGYVFQVSSRIHINLPGNSQNLDFSFTLRKAASGYQLGGTLSSLSLTIGGATLAMSNLTLNNSGLTVASATFSLPPSLGGSVTVSDIRITGSGLSIGSGTINLPDITFGGGASSKLKLVNGTVQVQIEGSAYTLSGSGTLQLRLPGNSQDIQLAFTIRGGVFQATLSGLNLTVAGCTLAMQQLTFNNQGMRVQSAALTLPARFGGATATVYDVSITRDGLLISGGEFAIPEIRIGDGSKLKVTNIRARFTILSGSYSFSINGTLNLNLPGNAQNIAVSFQIDSNGNLQGTISAVRLNVAGASLAMQNLRFNNNGLTVNSATLTLPNNMGSATLNNISITPAGLSIGGGQIVFPDIKIGNGTKVKVVRPMATLTATSGGYTFGINGTLQLRLPQNSQDIAISLTLNTAGQFSGSLSGITLKLATVDLRLTNIIFDNNGLYVSRGELKLPSSLGGGSGWVNDVRIGAYGLTIGGGGANIPFPDFRIGGSSGFSVTGARLTITINSDSTYRIALNGTVAIRLPGASANATGAISIDSRGNFSGSVDAFSIGVAGLTLGARGITLGADGTLKMSSAELRTPAGFGGLAVTVYDVRISPSGISIGGGSFTLPTIRTGGLEMSLSGSLRRVSNPDGYEISARGVFKLNQLGAAGGCKGIEVGVTLFATTWGESALLIRPADEPENAEQIAALRLAPPGSDLQQTVFTRAAPDRQNAADPPTSTAVQANAPASTPASQVADPQLDIEPAGLRLREASLNLYCQIPIGNTGLFLTSLRGSVTVNEGTGNTRIYVGLSIAAGRQIMGTSIVSADASATLDTSPFKLVLEGTVRVFIFSVGGARAAIDASSFSATLWMDVFVARGSVSVNAWSDWRGFHLTGSANFSIGFSKGSVVSECIAWWLPCIYIPPFSVDLGGVGADVGEFTNGAWGFKGYANILGLITIGFYIDTRGNFSIGNVDGYRLITRAQVEQARRLWLAAPDKTNLWSDILSFPEDDVVLVAVPVTQTTDMVFSLGRSSDLPTLTLLTPSGQEITPLNLPPEMTYLEVVTYTRYTRPGIAPAITTGPPIAADDTTLSVEEKEAAAILAERVVNGKELTAAEPEVMLRFVHAVPNLGAVDLWLNNLPVFTNAAALTATTYISLPAGRYDLKLLPAGATTPVILSTSLNVVSQTDYTLAAVGSPAQVDTVLLTDGRDLIDLGGARLRLVHLSPSTPAVDLVTADGAPLVSNVAYQTASSYPALTAGDHRLQVRLTGSDTTLITLPVTLAEGSASSLFLLGEADSLQAVTGLDFYGYRSTQVSYFVPQAAAGVWQMKLTGTPGPADTYLVSVDGANPAPGLSDVTAVLSGPTEATIGWRITSDEPTTNLSIYANPGAITTTLVITHSGDLTETTVITNFTGQLLATNIPSPLDGQAYQTVVSLSHLRSGTYYIWVEADDGRNPELQVYAPNPLSVDQSAAWTPTWSAPVTVTTDYRRLNLVWESHPHPDVDGYVVYLGTTPLTMTPEFTASLRAEMPLEANLDGLDAGQEYHLAIVAYSDTLSRTSQSQLFTATAGVAVFAVTPSSPALTLVGGQETSSVITVSTALTTYPEAVGLYPVFVTDGLSLIPVATVVTPTQAGVPVAVVVTTTTGVTGGDYSLPLLALGGGWSQTTTFQITLLKPHFDLMLTPATITLRRGQVQPVTIATTALHGDSAPISFDLTGAPDGLQWHFDGDPVIPGGSVTLILTDTELLPPGQYTLQVVGENDHHQVEQPLTLIVDKAAFTLTASETGLSFLPGGQATVLLDVTGQAGWTGPVTLSVAAADVPPGASVGFLSAGSLVDQIVVTAPGQATLQVTMTAETPPSFYLLPITGESNGQQQTLDLTLDLRPYRFYLQVILWQATPGE